MTLFRISLRLLAVVVCLLPLAARGQGGPPFRTDDPETPGNHNWEINFGFIADRNPGAGAYQVPDFDINYGLGDRIQLKYEIPIAIAEERPGTTGQSGTSGSGNPGSGGTVTPGHVLGGLGESLLGVKIRFYEHHPGEPFFGRNPPTKSEKAEGEEPRVDLSISTYPQLGLDNPTRAVPRGVVPPGPDLLLPLEANGRIGPVRLDAEVGYHFGNHALPQSWIRGLIVGHEFSERTELYAEIYDQQETNRVPGLDGVVNPKQRESTLGAGGRQALNRKKSLNLLFMGGRSFQKASSANGQPSWIAYIGLQVLLGPDKPETPQVEEKLPNEDKAKP